MDIGMLRGIGTVLVLVAFTCVTLWAYSGKRAKAFDDAANLPFADEPNRPLKNVDEAAGARQKQAKKRSVRVVHEHFEPAFNDATATQVVFQQPVQSAASRTDTP
ncbi:hypothetical protein DNK10_07565 [Pseudomonas daroniae]|nr:hypothetical protein DNK10_07565 [Pseudomonas daroniae]